MVYYQISEQITIMKDAMIRIALVFVGLIIGALVIGRIVMIMGADPAASVKVERPVPADRLAK